MDLDTFQRIAREAQDESSSDADRKFLSTFTPERVEKLIDLVARAKRAFVPGLLDLDNMWGAEAREWSDDLEKLLASSG